MCVAGISLCYRQWPVAGIDRNFATDMTTSAAAIRREFRKLGNAAVAEHSQRFFKTGEGEYGAGDKFLGIRVPVIRQHVRKHRSAPLRAVVALLKSPWHEERLFAVLSLADRFKRGDEEVRKAVFDIYIEHRKYINNWDLVDGSAYIVVGGWLETRGRKLLYRYARSKELWERRIAIMSTFHFIRLRDFDDTLAIAEVLLNDKEDLIHKASGWMLREVGNRHLPTEEKFLKKHYQSMPRTMLRYAIEKFPEKKRQAYLKGKV